VLLRSPEIPKIQFTSLILDLEDTKAA